MFAENEMFKTIQDGGQDGGHHIVKRCVAIATVQS